MMLGAAIVYTWLMLFVNGYVMVRFLTERKYWAALGAWMQVAALALGLGALHLLRSLQ